MIILFPLTPILVALLVLVLALLSGTSSEINTIITVAWVVVFILSAILLVCNFVRKVSVREKILGSIISIVATIVCLVESKTFLFGLAESASSKGLFGMIEFGFVLIFGGCVWLASAGMCSYASFVCVDPDEFDDWRYLKAVGYIIGSLLLGGLFGLMG